MWSGNYDLSMLYDVLTIYPLTVLISICKNFILACNSQSTCLSITDIRQRAWRVKVVRKHCLLSTRKWLYSKPSYSGVALGSRDPLSNKTDYMFLQESNPWQTNQFCCKHACGSCIVFRNESDTDDNEDDWNCFDFYNALYLS